MTRFSVVVRESPSGWMRGTSVTAPSAREALALTIPSLMRPEMDPPAVAETPYAIEVYVTPRPEDE